MTQTLFDWNFLAKMSKDSCQAVMKRLLQKLTFLSLASLLLLKAWSAIAQNTYTLEDLYNRAVQFHESIPIAEKEIERVKNNKKVIIGSVAPLVTVEGSELIQEKVNVGSGGVTQFNRGSTPEVSIALAQPIFHGFIEHYGLKKNNLNLEKTRIDYAETKRRLFLDVTITALTYKGLKDEVSITQKKISVQRKFLNELESQNKVGKILSSQYENYKAELLVSEAELVTKRNQMNAALERLNLLTGVQNPKELRITFNSSLLSDLNTYLQSASAHPNIQRARLDSQMARLDTKMAQGELYPNTWVEGRYYPYRTGVRENVDWDVLFRLEWPILNFQNYGLIRQNKIIAEQRNLSTQLTVKEVESAIRTAYHDAKTLFQLENLQRSAASQLEKAYTLSEQDFRNGLIDLTELLNSQNRYLENFIRLRETQKNLALTYVQLLDISGRSP